MEEKHPIPPDSPQEGAGESRLPKAPCLETLQAELEEADRERSQFRALAQRAQADLVNLRRRAEEEREEVYRSTAARLMIKLLAVLDDLERALDHIPASAEESGWLEGIRVIDRNLRTLLEAEGVTRIDADGKTFDPWEHEAMFAVNEPGKQEGTVVTVIRPGYKLHGKVLRAAQVAVAQGVKTKEQGPASSDEAPDPQEKDA